MSGTAEPQDPFAPLIKEVLIEKPVAEVFDFFTRLNDWWPMASHSMGRGRSRGMSFPAAAGDEIRESLIEGPPQIWGTVKHHAAPESLIFTWHPGRPKTEATEVEVTFIPEGPRLTRVRLIHRGWEILAGEPVNWRGEYDKAWDFVFAGCFAARCRDI